MKLQLIADPQHGDVIDARDTMYPSLARAVSGDAELGNPTSSYYGFVVKGGAKVQTPGFDLEAREGAWFAAPGSVQLAVDGLAVVIERFGYRCPPQAGSIEHEGRLSYIDGCSDTVLVAPARQGDPVFNLLHFPVGIDQSVHSHPSIRLGVVARGHGEAYGPDGNGATWRRPLSPGAMFLLPAHEMHAFSTRESKGPMDVIAYHPDSDWGPTDGVHPMLNRTYRRDG